MIDKNIKFILKSNQEGVFMKVSKKIIDIRNDNGLTQEEFADILCVSRQTISNWENDKNYPDVNSLVLLSEVFQISLDKLIKGDIDIMKEVIQKEEVSKMNRYSTIYAVLLITLVVSAVPLSMWLGIWAFIPWGIIFVLTMYFALKIEKIKKENDIQTYKEILAFSEGKRLDEIQKQREIGKRPYQKFLLAISSAVIALAICLLISLIIHSTLN